MRRALNRSLSLRLLAFAGAAIGLALLIAWLALGLLFERHAERQLQAELERHGMALIAALQIDPQGRPTLDRPLTDPRFIRPAGGLYWRLSAPAGEFRSRSLWDGRIPAPAVEAHDGWTAFEAAGPFEDQILVVARTVRLPGRSPAVLVEVAADRQPLLTARAAFSAEAAVFLALLWLALAVAAWIQVRLGLGPLRAVGKELTAMSATPDARLSHADHPVEIRALTDAINTFADRRAADVERARERSRDLAHALKTPLTALRLQIEGLDPARAREMTHSLALLTGAVEGELARTTGSAKAEAVAVAPLVDRLLAVISRTPDGTPLTLRNALPADLAIPLGAEAALEALGALIENAARHARSAVEITGSVADTGCWIAICDDGPGIPPDQRAAALGRGTRLDERGSRHGLGLAIAQQFVTASGGELELANAELGGLCVRLSWPARDA